MFILITYDVSTNSTAGRKRLRRISKICEDYGQRVQQSVFECWVDNALWVSIRSQLLSAMDTKEDSLRFYFLGNNWSRRVEHIGVNPAYDPEGPLIA